MPTQKSEALTPEALAAEQAGIDLSLLERNLSLSIEARLEQHQRSLDMILELRQAKRQFDEEHYEKPKQPAQSSR